jgi:hypothetical protein
MTRHNRGRGSGRSTVGTNEHGVVGVGGDEHGEADGEENFSETYI